MSNTVITESNAIQIVGTLDEDRVEAVVGPKPEEVGAVLVEDNESFAYVSFEMLAAFVDRVRAVQKALQHNDFVCQGCRDRGCAACTSGYWSIPL